MHVSVYMHIDMWMTVLKILAMVIPLYIFVVLGVYISLFKNCIILNTYFRTNNVLKTYIVSF